MLQIGDVYIDSRGLRLGFDGSTSVGAAADCILPYDPGASLETPANLPSIDTTPPGIPEGHQMGGYIDDDFGNQAMYALWRSGLLCQTVDADLLGDDLPLPFDTSLISLLVGDMFDSLFPEPQDMVIVTRPETPPILDLSGDLMTLDLQDFGMGFITELDHRQVNLLDVNLGLRVGLDLPFDPLTGMMALNVDLSQGVTADVLRNEFAAGTDEQIEESISGLLGDPLIAGIIDDSLGGIAIELPSIELVADEPVGVTDLFLLIDEVIADWIGLYIWAGDVDYVNAGGLTGCDDSSGCGDSSGCAESKGCTDSEGCTDATACTDTSGCEDTSQGSTGSSCDCDESSDCDSGCSISGSFGSRIMLSVFTFLLVGLRRRGPNRLE
jgi:hypothetical protein